MKTQRVLTAMVVVLSAAGLSWGAHRAQTGMSDTIGPATYIERGPLTVVVDSYPARVRAEDSYLPIRIAAAIPGKGHPLELDDESFMLIDSMGHKEPLASYRAVMKNYGSKRLADETLFRQRPMALGFKFQNYTRIPTRFFPVQGRGTRLATVDLRPFTWFRDVLYFQRPPAGVDGTLTLRVTSRDLPHPLDVRFRVR